MLRFRNRRLLRFKPAHPKFMSAIYFNKILLKVNVKWEKMEKLPSFCMNIYSFNKQYLAWNAFLFYLRRNLILFIKIMLTFSFINIRGGKLKTLQITSVTNILPCSQGSLGVLNRTIRPPYILPCTFDQQTKIDSIIFSGLPCGRTSVEDNYCLQNDPEKNLRKTVLRISCAIDFKGYNINIRRL